MLVDATRTGRAVLTTGQPLPVYPDNRTFRDLGSMSRMCQQQTFETGK
jgi:hypothetical protein